jgi:hypothetical protein
MAIIYAHIRLDTNDIFYIGRGIDYKRPVSRTNRNKYWHNIVNKYGYRVEILWESNANMTKEEAWVLAGKKEIEFIKKYGRMDLGEGKLVNMTDGGEGVIGKIYTEKYRENLRKSHIGIQAGDKHPLYGKPRTEETKKKLSEANRGKKLSIEHRKNIGIGNKGRIVSAETRSKIGMAHSGKIVSKESKEKMRNAKLGKPSKLIGKSPSKESIKKMSESHIGSKWMNNTIIESQVMKSKINEYLLNNWVFGRLK